MSEDLVLPEVGQPLHCWNCQDEMSAIVGDKDEPLYCYRCFTRIGSSTLEEIRLEPARHEPAPDLKLHGPLCDCTAYCHGKPLKPLYVVPFAVLDPATRARGEEKAFITYDDVKIELSLTYLKDVIGLLHMDRKSIFEASHDVLRSALKEIERRMWRKLENKT